MYAAGDGNTTIDTYDTETDRQDVLRFMDGITPGDDVQVSRYRNDLKLTLQGTGEIITVRNYFHQDGTSGYALNAIEFVDGTSWDLAAVMEKQIIGTDANNTITGYGTEDTIHGGAGNDVITGGAGHDTLRGEADNDTLRGQDGNDDLEGGDGRDTIYGDNGNDVLEGGDERDALYGGNGNDTLRGGTGTGDYLSGDAGSDTYIFGAGIGSDTVNNYDASATSVDIARFEDVSIEDLWFSRSGNNLQIAVAGTDDQVTINYWYSNANYQLDQIEVGSSVLLNNQVEQLVSAMASYSVPNGAGNVIPQDVKDELQPLLTEVWQTM